jgi:DNA-binding IscR family transcriptional regulator
MQGDRDAGLYENELILLDLRNRGLMQSRRGSQGGDVLAAEVYDNTTLQDLIDDERTAARRSDPLVYVV